ncbi:MAG TPA: hypothetical protein VMT85_11035 [Thermoanaerobaculia bacterium]|nr:hypothetical protein [Thermoanaerobaculia bacterium]
MSKVAWRDLVLVVLGAVVLGVALGFGAALAARAFGWPTGFVGPLTGGVVGALVSIFYRGLAQRRAGGDAIVP